MPMIFCLILPRNKYLTIYNTRCTNKKPNTPTTTAAKTTTQTPTTGVTTATARRPTNTKAPLTKKAAAAIQTSTSTTSKKTGSKIRGGLDQNMIRRISIMRGMQSTRKNSSRGSITLTIIIRVMIILKWMKGLCCSRCF